MELGIGMFGDLRFDKNSGHFQDAGERMKEIIDEVKLADKLGIDVFAMGEHHRMDYAVAAPEIMLAAMATVTKRIKLSSGVTVLSSSDPVKVYQDFSMIDLMSDGRVEIMAGRGSFIESFPVFGYDLRDYNQLFEEKLELLDKLNKEEVVNWEGRFRPKIEEQVIYPRPGRRLPIWIAVGGTPESVIRAARYGFPIIFAIIGGRWPQFKPLIDLYKEEYQAAGNDPDVMQIGVHCHTFLDESEEKLIENYFDDYAAQMNRIGKDRGWPLYTQMQFKGGLSPEGALVMGDAEQAAEKIIKMVEFFGLSRYVAHLDVGAPRHKDMMKAIEIYGEEVVPKVKAHFGS